MSYISDRPSAHRQSEAETFVTFIQEVFWVTKTIP